MKNAEAAIFNRRRWRVKSLSTAGRRERGLKNFWTGVGLPIWGGGGTFAGRSVHHYMKSNFHLFNDPFHCAKFRKSSYSRSRVMKMHHFWTQYGPFAPNKFFWKIIIILIYLLAPFIVQNLKKLLPADPEL